MVEIILIRFNNKEVENECIERILDCTLEPYNLSVYDNYKKNEHLSVVFNRLILRSDSEYILLLNTDAFVEPHWLTNLLLELKEGVGAVGPVSNNGGKEQTQVRGQGIQEANMLGGWCLLFRKSTWEAVGGFDENYRFYFEDDDFCEAIKKLGLKLYLVKSVFVEHRQRSSVDRNWKREEVNLVFNQSREYFEKKWGVTWLGGGQEPTQKTLDVIVIGLKEGPFSERCIRTMEETADMPIRIIKSFGSSIAENFNKGLAKTASDVIVFVQDDWEFLPNKWLSRLYNSLIKCNANYVSAKQILPNEKIHCAWLEFIFTNKEFRVKLVGRFSDKNNYSVIVRQHGVPVLIKRARAIEIGGMDENFKVQRHEEPDFDIRLGSPLYNGEVSIIHHFEVNPDTEKDKYKFEIQNRALLIKKHSKYKGV